MLKLLSVFRSLLHKSPSPSLKVVNHESFMPISGLGIESGLGDSLKNWRRNRNRTSPAFSGLDTPLLSTLTDTDSDTIKKDEELHSPNFSFVIISVGDM